jgi:cyclopropane fatty-acyl-phospholipid synthase-like methyltransferase
MGSAVIQGPLWGKQSKDWATIQEQTGNAGYVCALNFLNLNPAVQLLDIGCGSGVFSSLASATGA